MPDESCRRCGGNLESCAKCPECRDSIQNICKICQTKTDEKFHAGCFFGIELSKTPEILIK